MVRSVCMDSLGAPCDSPAVFFRGEYAFRTLNGAMAIVAALVTSAIGSAFAIVVLSKKLDSLTVTVGGIFAAVASVFGGVGLCGLWNLARNRRVKAEVNDDGIILGHRFWPWDEIRSLAGKRYDNGVCLEFTPIRRVVWGGGHLLTTLLLDDAQYIQLAHELARRVSARFPHVTIAMAPEDATAI